MKFILFTAQGDWCGPCNRLKNKESLIRFAKNVRIQEITFSGENELKETDEGYLDHPQAIRYQVRGIPAFVITDGGSIFKGPYHGREIAEDYLGDK